MLDAVQRGNGRMAQFSHPVFGGSGQWMRGGMTMISSMFDDQLKGRVDALCRDLAALVERRPGLAGGGSFQSQSQGDSVWRDTAGPDSAGRDGWPQGLSRRPDSAGSQNGMRYAYFADERRLAIDDGGRVTVYDTLDHRIGGVSQQQSTSGELRFSSQHGTVDLRSLPVVPAEVDVPGPSTRP